MCKADSITNDLRSARANHVTLSTADVARMLQQPHPRKGNSIPMWPRLPLLKSCFTFVQVLFAVGNAEKRILFAGLGIGSTTVHINDIALNATQASTG
jgi:hypothetical protein